MTVATHHFPRRPTPVGEAATRGDAAGTLHGIARHVTEDGCQFVTTGPTPKSGCRLRCLLSSNPAVSGVVRWIVEDRIGFAFDQPLDAGSLAELASHSVQVKAIVLEPCR
ncbi:PilZ domain-containing protein [Novosphingobium chloroacetimidivorans]|nr:PilZ domain-containing protein [Novosphingobium chloroacetimidivorans]